MGAAREAAHFLAWWRPPAQLIETSACARFSLTAPPMEPPELAWQRERELEQSSSRPALPRGLMQRGAV